MLDIATDSLVYIIILCMHRGLTDKVTVHTEKNHAIRILQTTSGGGCKSSNPLFESQDSLSRDLSLFVLGSHVIYHLLGGLRKSENHSVQMT